MIRDFITRPFVRKFLVDFVETFIPLLAGIAIVVPQNTDGLVILLTAIGSAVLAAFTSAGRRAWPDFRAYLTERLLPTELFPEPTPTPEPTFDILADGEPDFEILADIDGSYRLRP